MRDANIERLLGGYATNTLTEAERKSLFEAALADQELFNALQAEETLRDLLDDVESRHAIERALRQAASQQPRRHWLMPAWAWGLAGSAVATAALIFAVLMPKVMHNEKVEVAVSKPTLPVVTPGVAVQESPPVGALRENMGPVARRKSVASSEAPVAREISAASTPAPAEPTAPHVSQRTVQDSQTVNVRAEQPPADAQAVVQALAASPAAGFRAASAGYVAAPIVGLISTIPYSVLKRGADGSSVPMTQGEELKSGDSVQLMLHPPVSGSLIMQEQIPGGNWRTVFPAGISVLRVTAKQDVVIPDPPIQVNSLQHLRLILTPAEPGASIALRRSAKLAVNQDKQRLETTQASTEPQDPRRPLVTNVTLAPGKPGGSISK
ncbi:MAG: hypothetical protein M3Y27_22000 [Acidobacteriota bacterium]|nr:hypothetical protein [Acidobacteriota bacterium]